MRDESQMSLLQNVHGDKEQREMAVYFPGGGGGTLIWNRQGHLSEILNLTPKGDHMGVAQAFCDP